MDVTNVKKKLLFEQTPSMSMCNKYIIYIVNLRLLIDHEHMFGGSWKRGQSILVIVHNI